MKLDILLFFGNLSHLNVTRITVGYRQTDICTAQYIMVMARSVFLIVRNLSEKKIVGKIKTRSLCTVILFPKIVSFMK